ncbi:MAG TPA: hypothetical protein VJZ00_01335 [Thermoanaerobaculia bacterium]|nr:hypothetical protein [Thermoanaerobaculia bacterium]
MDRPVMVWTDRIALGAAVDNLSGRGFTPVLARRSPLRSRKISSMRWAAAFRGRTTPTARRFSIALPLYDPARHTEGH